MLQSGCGASQVSELAGGILDGRREGFDVVCRRGEAVATEGTLTKRVGVGVSVGVGAGVGVGVGVSVDCVGAACRGALAHTRKRVGIARAAGGSQSCCADPLAAPRVGLDAAIGVPRDHLAVVVVVVAVEGASYRVVTAATEARTRASVRSADNVPRLCACRRRNPERRGWRSRVVALG
jgi:hypothetical protein